MAPLCLQRGVSNRGIQENKAMAKEKLYYGIDSGASATKVLLVDELRNIVAWRRAPSGPEINAVARKCRNALLKETIYTASDIAATAATGYGRDQVTFADSTKTEIACQAKGCLHFFHPPFTIVDIGGQDNKIITLDENGKVAGFKFNRKCAAGTGAFLEEIAALLHISLAKLDSLACQAEAPVKLGSFCTVFAKTEILANFKRGTRTADIVAGAFESVMRRIIEMDPLNGEIVLTGGVVACNPYTIGLFERTLGKQVKVPFEPQFTGALGAALFALESEKEE